MISGRGSLSRGCANVARALGHRNAEDIRTGLNLLTRSAPSDLQA